MRKRNIIITLLVLSCILLIILVFIIFKVNKDNRLEDNENRTPDSNTNNSSNEVNIIKGNNQENVEEIKKVKISIENTPNDIVDKIIDKDNFTFALKKFLYENNLTEINNIIFLNHVINNNKLYLYYRGYKNTRIYFEITVDLQNNTTSVCFGGD